MTPCSLDEFKRAMSHLVVLKRTSAFTPLQFQTWHHALGMFDVETINAAVLEMALVETRFPEVGDLYQICRRRAIKADKLQILYSPHSGNADSKIPSQDELRLIAARFGLAVD